MTKQYRQLVALGIGALGVAGAVVVRGRTARLRGATARNVATTPYALVAVALRYSAGPRPSRVIIDVRSGQSSGSATVEGEEDDVEIPLDGPMSVPLAITVTASTRVWGRLVIQRYQ